MQRDATQQSSGTQALHMTKRLVRPPPDVAGTRTFSCCVQNNSLFLSLLVQLKGEMIFRYPKPGTIRI